MELGRSISNVLNLLMVICTYGFINMLNMVRSNKDGLTTASADNALDFQPPPDFQPIYGRQTSFIRVTTLLNNIFYILKETWPLVFPEDLMGIPLPKASEGCEIWYYVVKKMYNTPYCADFIPDLLPGQELDQYRTNQTVNVQYAILKIEPYAMIKWDGTNSTNTMEYEGFMVDLMDRISQIVGFKYKMVPVKDGKYGYRQATGTWDGLIGELMNKEADIAAAPLYVTKHRMEVVDFTQSVLNVQATVLMRRPPTGRRSRINKVEDLLAQSEIRYGTLNTGMIIRAFRTSNNSVYSSMWRDMKRFRPTVFTRTNEEGISRIRKEKYAFIIPSTIGDYISRRLPCDLITKDRFLMNREYGLATQKGSGLLPKLNSALDLLHSSGYLDYIYDKWWIKKSECNGIKSSKIYSLSGSCSTSLLTKCTIAICLVLSLHSHVIV